MRIPFDYAVLPYNDAAAAEAEFAARGADIACVLVEPMLGSGGCIPGDPAFLAALRRLTADAGAVLIFDEVMTSRLALGGAQELLGITPDMTTLGKYLAGGLSFGAFGGRADLMAAFDPARGGGLTHGGTFNNNAFTMAVGAAAADASSTPRRSPPSTSGATGSAPGSTPASRRRRSTSAPPGGARSSTSTPWPVPCTAG